MEFPFSGVHRRLRLMWRWVVGKICSTATIVGTSELIVGVSGAVHDHAIAAAIQAQRWARRQSKTPSRRTSNRPLCYLVQSNAPIARNARRTSPPSRRTTRPSPRRILRCCHSLQAAPTSISGKNNAGSVTNRTQSPDRAERNSGALTLRRRQVDARLCHAYWVTSTLR